MTDPATPLTDDELETLAVDAEEGGGLTWPEARRLLATTDALRAEIEGLYTPEVYAQAIERAEKTEAVRDAMRAEHARLIWERDRAARARDTLRDALDVMRERAEEAEAKQPIWDKVTAMGASLPLQQMQRRLRAEMERADKAEAREHDQQRILQACDALRAFDGKGETDGK